MESNANALVINKFEPSYAHQAQFPSLKFSECIPMILLFRNDVIMSFSRSKELSMTQLRSEQRTDPTCLSLGK